MNVFNSLFIQYDQASTRVRQRFVVQQAKHIQCMKFIPGGVEQGDGENGGGKDKRWYSGVM